MMEILKDSKNDLLGRRELVVQFEGSGNPGVGECKKNAVDKLKALEETVVVKSLKNNFGSGTFLAELFVYDSKEALDLIERKSKKGGKDGKS